ncbi:cactin-like [Dreissena polymorpha]|uniref:Splicing factor Cactin n=1 Tax=Dreissena polymorpha TaxID=45954 RepID=A0A9D3YR32_DREPO|nr:cactin-like [Dreissena polymorpha]KAH3703344.1 hypothetical protein DPMN_078379 [Dreissena polymorpha]
MNRTKSYKSRSRSRSREKHRKRKYDRERSSDSSEERDRNKRKKKKSKKASSRSRSPHDRDKRKHRRDSNSGNESDPRSRSHKSKKHRGSDSSDSDASDGEGLRGGSVLSRLSAEQMEKLKEEARLRKSYIKAVETPEEKRARRLAKKEAKERKRREKMGWDQEYMGYTNVDNPFGDEHLTDTFVWTKKISKEGNEELDKNQIHMMTKKKMEENRVELEKVKKRRLEREREREERENEREMLQRDKEAEYYREWEKSEDTFHLQQAKMRSEIRIQDGRAKPIDLLAKYISAEDDELAVEMHEPYTYLYGLTSTDLEDLLEDIKVYLELEQGKNTEYWRDIVTVTEDELQKLRKLENTRDYRDLREGVNAAVTDEVVAVFKGKTTKQLLLLEEQMRKKLAGGEGVDVGYWESLLQQLKAHMAKTRLRERHQDVLRKKLFKLKQEQGIESAGLFPAGLQREGTPNSDRATPNSGRSTPVKKSRPTGADGADDVGSRTEDVVKVKQEEEQPGTSTFGLETQHSPEPEAKDNENDEIELSEEDFVEDPAVVEYRAGNYSPVLFAPREIDDLEAVIYDPLDDMKKLALARTQVKSTGKVRLDQESELIEKAREGMDDEEAQFSVQHELEKQSFLWSDKYRPRKPRFFNRVHTGFEWNKYNQTHYDIDNPPPKIVQGYKFNIFYPDLIDKSRTPEYTVTPIPSEPDFAILKFHAGPPYEDIAFKVVNKEWEHSYKRSFRCQFANNIMQLWFHFKRERYRR